MHSRKVRSLLDRGHALVEHRCEELTAMAHPVPDLELCGGAAIGTMDISPARSFASESQLNAWPASPYTHGSFSFRFRNRRPLDIVVTVSAIPRRLC